MIERIPEPSVRARWRKAATDGISADDLRPAVTSLTAMVKRMDLALEIRPWPAGEDYSLADINIAPYVQRLVRIELFHLV